MGKSGQAYKSRVFPRNQPAAEGEEGEKGEEEEDAQADVGFGAALLRASGGALLFSLPTLMTLEMWNLGFYMEPLRLVLFLILTIPLLLGLTYYAGFEENFTWLDSIIDVFVAYAIGFIISGLLLPLFAAIEFGMSVDEIIGKIAIQAIPSSIGAMLSRSQLWGGEPTEKRRRREASYLGTLFLIAVGALVISFNISPTVEVTLIAYKMTPWHAIVLAMASLLLICGFVYVVETSIHDDSDEDSSEMTAAHLFRVFLRYGVVGYALALLISAFVLWTFGRYDGTSTYEFLAATIVLGFPASLGVGAAQLIL